MDSTDRPVTTNGPIVCPNCRYENEPGAIMCTSCGRALSPSQGSAKPTSAAPTIRVIVWLAAIAVTGFVFLFGYTGSHLATGAPQQAAGAAIDCFYVISAYVIARAIDSMTRP